MSKPKLFVSYSRKDLAYLNEFKIHLAGLRRKNQIEVWTDQEIDPGKAWEKHLREQLGSADIIIFLVSPDFIASNYIYDVEIKKAIERYDNNEVTIIPIILRPCDFSSIPLNQFQALPENTKPISKWEDRDEAWLDVINGLKRTINKIDKKTQKSITFLSNESEVISDSASLSDYTNAMDKTFAVHLAYSVFPPQNEEKFIETKRNTFQKYIEETNKSMFGSDIPSTCYRPLVFHLFGSFDVVLISLIDNYKFCQKVFDIDSTDYGVSTNYQILTGFYDKKYYPNNSFEDLRNYFPEDNKRVDKLSNFKFVHITNFKLNNGLLIGNGNTFLDAVMTKLHGELNKANADFLIFKSFNWSEITLIQFGDELVELQERIIEFRELSLASLDNSVFEFVINNSLYNYIHNDLDDTKEWDINYSHIFVDSHSYSGVDYFEFNKNYKELKIQNPYENVSFKSSIELQVKPGHLNAIYDILKSPDDNSEKTVNNLEMQIGDSGKPVDNSGKEKIFDETTLKFKNGKTDYLVKETDHNKFVSNYNVNQIYRHGKRLLSHHVRRLKTNFLFDIKEYKNIENNSSKNNGNSKYGITNFSKILSTNYSIDVAGLKINIKKLGVSRQLREKILKAFYNYNNLIRDVILFGEFIELKAFLKLLKDDIDAEVCNLNSFFKNPINDSLQTINYAKYYAVRRLENKWKIVLEIYEEAYQNRVHNNYLYEDLNEFSIDFNSAVNQVNTVHDFMVKTVNNLFFPDSKDQIIVTQNAIDTKSNIVNVNYNVYHFLEPSLIFTTLFKEIINGLELRFGKKNNLNDRNILLSDENYFKTLKEEIRFDIEYELTETQKILFEEFDFFYFFADIAKLAYTFLFDYELYEYWSWTYFLQDSSHYLNYGLPEESLFKKEFFRISLIKAFFEDDKSKVKCPTSDLFDLWQNSIEEIYKLANKIVDNEKFKTAIYEYSEYIFVKCFRLKDEEFTEMSDKQLKEISDKILKKISKLSIKIFHETDNFDAEKLISYEIGIAKCIDVTLGNSRGATEFYNILKLLKASSLKCSVNLEKGETPDLNEIFELEKGSFYIISALSHAVLSTFFKKGKKLKFLNRNREDGIPFPISKNSIGEPSVYVDPLGGYFHNCSALKNEFFTINNIVTNTLWHYALIDKKRLFLKDK